MNLLLSIVLTAIIPDRFAQLTTLNVLAEWKVLEFEFPTEEEKTDAFNTGRYVPENCVPIDVDVYYNSPVGPRATVPISNIRGFITQFLNIGVGSSRDQASTVKIFVTVPRFTTGIPITLGTISDRSGTGGPMIRAYPNYNWHSSEDLNCGNITSVFRVTIDNCGRLWILDSGRVGSEQLCPPQILVFDLSNDQLVHRYKFPQDLYTPGISLFVLRGTDCNNILAYIAYSDGFGIVVYDWNRAIAWRAENKLTYPNPDYGTFTIAGESFDLMDGIFGLALSPGHSLEGGPKLYFHALASMSENSVPLALLNNESIWQNSRNSDPRSFVKLGDRGEQSTAEAMDRRGNLFFGLTETIAIGCWSSNKTSYSRETIRVVAANEEQLQFASGLKIVNNLDNNEELWVLTNRYQRVSNGTISPDEVNFRIMVNFVNEILKSGGGSCATAGVPLTNYPLPIFDV